MSAATRARVAPRLLAAALAAAVAAGSPATVLAAAPASQGPPPPGVTVNGEPLDLSEVRNLQGTLYAPFDELVEAFAGQYYFDPASRTGRGFLTEEGSVVTARAGDPRLDVDGRTVAAPAPRMEAKLMVPLAAFFRALGAQVRWDAARHQAVVLWPAARVEQPDPAGATAAAAPADPAPADPPAPAVDPAELLLMEQVVNAEAYGAPEETQLAVAAVIVNRLRSGLWGKTLSDVLMAPGQFAVVRTGAYRLHPLAPGVEEAVRRALAGEDPTHGALYFTDLASVPAAWKDPARFTLTLTSGGMVFFRPRS
ncbi:MAG: cell wall hydrolase [Clostridia bacterium]|nr:cell wall hydrolase [Clostridia bacterium]MCL6521891.1 cell wall hydrolase [Bacillota bacterium]